MACAASATETYSRDWDMKLLFNVIDSGASQHLTPHIQLLSNFKNVAPYTTVTFVVASSSSPGARGSSEIILQ